MLFGGMYADLIAIRSRGKEPLGTVLIPLTGLTDLFIGSI